MNVFDPIFYWARVAPNRPAVLFPGGSLSYRQLCNAALHASVALRRSGFRPGELAAIAVSNPAFQITLMLALSRMNAPTLFQDSLESALALKADVKAYITDNPARVSGNLRVLVVDHQWFITKFEAQQAPALDVVESSPDSLLAIATSSGTTGEAKAFAVTQGVMDFRVKSWLLFPEARRMISMLPVKTSWGLLAMLRTLRSGGSFGFAPFPEQVLDLCESAGVQFILASVAQAATLVEAQQKRRRELPSLEKIFVGGSSIAPQLASELRKRVCKEVYMCYGASEAGQIAGGPLSSFEETQGCVGYINPGTQIQIVDPEDRSTCLPPGREGVLRLGGPAMVQGYLNVDNSEEYFHDGWFYPGDFASISHDQLLTISGRTSDLVINKGGVKIDPAIIEAEIKKLGDVRDVAVVAMTGRSGAPEIWAAIVPGERYSDEKLRQRCEEVMGGVAPDRYFKLASIPRNEIGKILYANVRSQLTAMGKRANVEAQQSRS